MPRATPGTSRADSGDEVTFAISEQIVRIYLESFGRRPTRIRTFVQPPFAVSVLRYVLTARERSLVDRGGSVEVETARAKINETIDSRCVSVVEEQTGRSVLSHLAQTRVPVDVAVHFFLFGDV
jgi:uncharacterized protein YbcI